MINKIRKDYGELDSIVIEMVRAKNSKEEKIILKEDKRNYEQEDKEVNQLLLEANYKMIKLMLKQKQKSDYICKQMVKVHIIEMI
ncbi:MAG: hypothetical protein V8R64_12660 [Thomasclavelia sp.]